MPPGKPKSGGKGLLIGAIVAVVLLVLCGGVGVAGVLVLRNSDRGGGADGGDNTVRLEVTWDSGAVVLIRWATTLEGMRTEAAASSPWTKELDVSGGSAVSVDVADVGNATCKITFGGEVRSEKQSAAGGRVTCSTNL